jgi:hypothetical protein
MGHPGRATLRPGNSGRGRAPSINVMFADLQQVLPGDLPARFPRSEPLAVLPNDDVWRDADLALAGHAPAAVIPRRPTSPCAPQHLARPPMKRLHGRFSVDRMSTARPAKACATTASLPSPSHMRPN